MGQPLLNGRMQRALLDATMAIPTMHDCATAEVLMGAYRREAAAYRRGWIDDPRPNPCLILCGVYGCVVSREDGTGQVFVPMRLIGDGCAC